MSYPKLTEIAVGLINDYIQANIDTELAGVDLDRGDHLVNTDPPQSYFIYNFPQVFKAPAVIIYADDLDFKKRDRGQNHINAEHKIYISVIIEERTAEFLTVKAWRYQAALHHLLDQVPLVSADKKVKIVIVVAHAAYSPIYTSDQGKGVESQVFRKEVSLELAVEHFEQP